MTKNVAKKKDIQWASVADGNASLMREVRGEKTDWFELTRKAMVAKITTLHNHGEQKGISEHTARQTLNWTVDHVTIVLLSSLINKLFSLTELLLTG